MKQLTSTKIILLVWHSCFTWVKCFFYFTFVFVACTYFWVFVSFSQPFKTHTLFTYLVVFIIRIFIRFYSRIRYREMDSFFKINWLLKQYIFEIGHFYSIPLPNTGTRSAPTASFVCSTTLSIGIFQLCVTHNANLKNPHENVSFPEASTSAIQGFK